MRLLVRGKRARAICRECRALHGAEKCPRVTGYSVITMREYRKREILEQFYGREVGWDEVFRISNSALYKSIKETMTPKGAA